MFGVIVANCLGLVDFGRGCGRGGAAGGSFLGHDQSPKTKCCVRVGNIANHEQLLCLDHGIKTALFRLIFGRFFAEPLKPEVRHIVFAVLGEKMAGAVMMRIMENRSGRETVF